MNSPFDNDFELPGASARPASAPNREIYTVGRLNDEVAQVLENSFPLIWVEGELSNLAQPRSGHMYFTLKDSRAQVRCALFRSGQNRLRFEPRDGMQVIARARVGLYGPRGEFQLVVQELEPAGEGGPQDRIRAAPAPLAGGGALRRGAQAAPARVPAPARRGHLADGSSGSRRAQGPGAPIPRVAGRHLPDPGAGERGRERKSRARSRTQRGGRSATSSS